MAIKALNLSATRNFVCSEDDADDPTIWQIGTLSSRDVGTIRDSATQISFGRGDTKGKGKADAEEADTDIKTSVNRAKMNFEAVRRGLKGVENFLDAEGNVIPFKLVIRDVGGGVKRSVVPNEFLDQMPLSVVEELAEQIMSDNMVEDGDEAGNSPEPSSGE
jgi:hypothetical protein